MKVGMFSTALVAAAMVLGAPATAACWSPRAAEAAQVRDFEMMMMVAMLRCRATTLDIAEDYNHFVRDKRAVLTSVNDELRSQLADGRSGKVALDAYDRFVTAMANSHGAGSANLNCDDFHAMIQTAIAASPDRGALLALAVRAGSDPALPTERCAPQFASAQ